MDGTRSAGAARPRWTLSLIAITVALVVVAGGTDLPVQGAPDGTHDSNSHGSASEPPLAGAITFARSTGRTIVLHTVDLSTGALQVHDTGPGTSTSPDWSPDGDRLVFARRSGVPYHLMDLDPMTGVVRQLTDGTAIDGSPTIGPDGTWLVFASNRGPGADFGLYRLALPPLGVDADARSAAPEYLTAGRAPDVAPDGARVAFEREGRVWLLDLASGVVAAATPPDERHSGPRFAPDGRSLATAREVGDEVRITSIELASGLQRDLTRGAQDRAPSWSPDGRHLVFVRVTSDGSDLHVVASAGGAALRLTEHPAADVAPSWHQR